MKGLKCRCGETAKEAKLRFQGANIDGWTCPKCGEEYFDPQQAERVLLLNKLKNKKFEVKVGQIRSNLIIRVPKEAQKALGLENGEKVVLEVQSGKKMLLTA